MLVPLRVWLWGRIVRQWIHVDAIKTRIWLLLFNRYDFGYLLSMILIIIIFLFLRHVLCELHQVVYTSLCQLLCYSETRGFGVDGRFKCHLTMVAWCRLRHTVVPLLPADQGTLVCGRRYSIAKRASRFYILTRKTMLWAVSDTFALNIMLMVVISCSLIEQTHVAAMLTIVIINDELWHVLLILILRRHLFLTDDLIVVVLDQFKSYAVANVRFVALLSRVWRWWSFASVDVGSCCVTFCA